jgi:hypothetical protein|tara:strand:- start:85 stop:195 length:111 start_codon:yes stop_codon:yes gene_type:complete
MKNLKIDRMIQKLKEHPKMALIGAAVIVMMIVNYVF